MGQYFDQVVSALSFEEVNLLSILLDQDATAAFKSMKSREVLELSGYSESVYRRILTSLTSAKFVGVVSANKQYSVFLTNWGAIAVNKSMNEVGA